MKRDWRLPLFVMLVSIGMHGCRSDFRNDSQTQLTYFSLEEFFNQEAARLNSRQVKADKSVTRNDSTESMVGVLPDWAKEFKPFVQCDINKPAWIKSYVADTVFMDDRHTSVRYTAIDQNLPVRNIAVMLFDEKVTSVTAEKRNDNYVFVSHQRLDYRVDSMISITGRQDVRLATDLSYRVTLRLNP